MSPQARQQQHQLVLRVVVIFAMCILCAASSLADTRLREVCITNCGQCKQMFGRYFHGQACAEACLGTADMIVPDCNNPKTLRGFISKFY